MSKTHLPEGITDEMVIAAKEKHAVVKIATLMSNDNEVLATVLVGSPNASVINQFQRLIDKDPGKAQKALVKGVLCSHLHIADEGLASELFNAAVSAASEMLPGGKAVLKNL